MHSASPLFLPRILYLLAGLAWACLLQPNPRCVFLAGCLACLSMPLYRSLRRFARRLRHRAEVRARDFRSAHPGRSAGFLMDRWLRARLALLRGVPILGSFLILFACFAVPVLVFMILVAPQIGKGYLAFRELWLHNFHLPPEWSDYLDGLMNRFSSVPFLARLLEEARSYLDTLSEVLNNFSSDTVSSLLGSSFKMLGGTMSVLWAIFLFFSLAMILTLNAATLRRITARVFHLRPSIMGRFVLAIRSALRAILLGVVLVAFIQGFLCAIGFFLADFKQFAFWGLLAALVAPIPILGTALVWVPLSLQLWFSGNSMAAMFLAFWGIFVVSTADSLLRPLFLKTGIRASYLVLILAILCGITAFGSLGIILGPVLLAFSVQAMEEANIAYPSALQSLAVRTNRPSRSS